MGYAGDITPHEAWKLLSENSDAALVDVRTLDHVIVAGSDTTSFAERGLI